jgi:hypothetical protein
MWTRRRALPAVLAGSAIALVLMPVTRQSITQQYAHRVGLASVSTPTAQVRAADTIPLQDDSRTVSLRERANAIARAQVWRTPKTPIARASLGADRTTSSAIECRFRLSELAGTTPRFQCVLDSGKELRATYGPGKELTGDAAATRLLSTLGFAADTVTLVEHLRCHGCPHESFAKATVVEATVAQPLYGRVVDPDTYEDFEWVSVGQKFAARPIEADKQKGWAFFELDSIDPSKGGAPRAHVDALRLLAVFLAHWDNKPENQRLVCLSKTWVPGTLCAEPFLLLQDLGSTFGPTSVDLEAWEKSMVWEDRAACMVSMRDFPYGGGTFGPTRVSERGRRFLVKLLGALTDAQLTDLFAAARFDKPRSQLMETKPVSDWVRVFKNRVRTIGEGPPCPDA